MNDFDRRVAEDFGNEYWDPDLCLAVLRKLLTTYETGGPFAYFRHGSLVVDGSVELTDGERAFVEQLGVEEF